MQGLIDLFASGRYDSTQEDIRGFYADFELIEVKTIQMINVTHRGFKSSSRGVGSPYFLQIFFREPAFTPIRMGMFLSRAQSTTMRIRSSLPILPG